jgi:hypothetical protein
MSQKPVTSRDNGADSANPVDKSTTENVSESLDDTASAPSGRKMAPTGKPSLSQAVRPSSSIAAHSRAAPASRAATGPVRAVAANDDMPSIGGLVYALQQRPSKSPSYIALGNIGT